MIFCNRSQVQGSTFRVKDKEVVKYPKPAICNIIIIKNIAFII